MVETCQSSSGEDPTVGYLGQTVLFLVFAGYGHYRALATPLLLLCMNITSGGAKTHASCSI